LRGNFFGRGILFGGVLISGRGTICARVIVFTLYFFYSDRFLAYLLFSILYFSILHPGAILLCYQPQFGGA
jgi:hypothetical protein